MTQFSGDLYIGSVYYPDAVQTARADYSDLGVQLPRIVAQEFGAVAAADDDGIVVSITPTAAGVISATGALVSGGVATFDVPRNVSITSTANLSAFTFSWVGTDKYGEAITESLAGPNNSTVYGLKAAKTLTSISATGATSAAIKVGSGTSIGFDFRLSDKGKLLTLVADGVDTLATAVVTAGLAATGVSTATTADVRGTVLPGVAPDGSKMFTALYLLDGNSVKANVYGAAQA